MGLEWDQILPTEIQDEVSKWIFGLDKIKNWKMQRCLSTQAWQDIIRNQNAELITFSDASEKAYGCCIYLKVIGKEPTVTLIMSKVRVAPLKRVTLPRLELLGALLSARLLNFCRTSIGLPVDCRYSCWTDSKIALDWIKSEPHRWKQFVCNRVTEIQELTCTTNWKHCAGKDNPADLLTRGIDSSKFISSHLWMHGPEWLIDTNEYHETDKDERQPSEPGVQAKESMRREMEMELKKPPKPDSDIVVLTSTETSIDSVMDFGRFGDFHKLLRTVGWILRFLQNVRDPPERISSKNLLSEELNNARLMIIKWTQGEEYHAEIKDLKKNGFVHRKSPIASLSPFLGADGLIRIHGRLEQAPSLLYDEKHPILLPKCHVSSLLVKSHHEMLKHAGSNTLITALRNKYWILSVRTLAKKVCRQCLRCQRQDARTLDQIPAPLPRDRVTKTPPFSVVGVDHAGPLFCSDSRPLTYVEETRQPLTPSHFLIGRGTPMVSAEMCDFDEDFVNLNLRKADQETEVDKFWNTWNDEYLRNLPPLKLKRPCNDLKIGSMVLIREENKPRLQWLIGLVTKLYPGRDGLVRAVELKTGHGVITRAVQKLCKLELNGEFEDKDNESENLSCN